MTGTEAFITDLGNLLGPRGFTQDPELVEPWLTDWRGRYSGRAIGIASPASTADVSKLVKLCAAAGVAIVPQGGNSGMAGGATPDKSGNALVLSLRRMNTVRTLDPATRQAVCDAGVVLQTLHEAAQNARLRFPLTLGGKGSATIGGLVSTNAGGTQVLRHGTMREQVLGIEAVLPDGSIFDALTPLKKDNRGFDLKQLLIGSEGTLGIVTAANLRLLPETGGRVTCWAGMPRLPAARTLLAQCTERHGDQLEGFEVIPKRCLQAVFDHLPNARSPLESEHEWNALIEFVALPGQEDVLRNTVEKTLSAAAGARTLEDAVIAANETQAEAFWHLRGSISAAERAIGPAMQHDISVPVQLMPDFVEETIPVIEQAFPGTQAIAFGHLGDGNVHYHVLAPKGAVRGEWEETDGKIISRFVHDLVTKWGGSISAEHGIGQMKAEELERLSDPVRLNLMRTIKRALDPNDIMNPGKLVTP